ncbi:MAG: MBL fold metallo-hydrolase [Xanthomonadales bacterium]|nr:MBL fold metallo-hydrolase [Xanthomonadales bacterium]
MKCKHRFWIAVWLVSLWTAASAHAPDMRVVLLGTGTPKPRIDRFGPATLVEAGGQKLLFDAGRGASQRLWQLKIPLGKIDAVFFTHLHSDHTVGFPDVWLIGWLPTPFGSRSSPLKVWGPKGTVAMMANLRKAWAWDIHVRGEGEHLPPAGIEIAAHDIAEGTVYQHGGVKVSAFLVDHGGLLKPAFGYRIDYAGHAVVISGDTRPNDNLVRHAKGTDVLVHEVAAVQPDLLSKSPTAPIARRILGFHTSPEAAGKIFARVKPRLAVFTHLALLTTDRAFPPPTTADVLRRARAFWPGRIVVGEDLMTIDIGDEITLHRFSRNHRTSAALRASTP